MCPDVGGDGPGRHDHGIGLAGGAPAHLTVPPGTVGCQSVRMGPRHRVVDRHHERHAAPPRRDEQRGGVHNPHSARRRPVATQPRGGKTASGQRQPDGTDHARHCRAVRFAFSPPGTPTDHALARPRHPGERGGKLGGVPPRSARHRCQHLLD